MDKNKKIIIAFFLFGIIVVIFVLWFLFKNTPEEDVVPKKIDNYTEDTGKDTYQIKDNKVYYREADNLRQIEEADIESFQILDNNYAKDKNNVYFKNVIIEEAEASTFTVIDELYCKDSVKVFCSNISVYKKEIKEADAQTFEKIQGDFYKDKDNIFRKCHISRIPNLDVDTFSVIDKKTVKDKNGKYNLNDY